ncbi:hypothetical protein B296_00052625, partial [Ensete ventricosum]
SILILAVGKEQRIHTCRQRRRQRITRLLERRNDWVPPTAQISSLLISPPSDHLYVAITLHVSASSRLPIRYYPHRHNSCDSHYNRTIDSKTYPGFREEREIETPTPELIDLEAEWVSEPFDLNSGGLISPRECGSPPLLARHTDRRAPFAPFRPSDRTLQLSKGTVEVAAEANGSTSLINKEDAITENGTHAVHADSGSEDTSKVVLHSSVERDEGPSFATENKVTDSSKVFRAFSLVFSSKLEE